ncbi:hypothetical protein [Sphaerisporangium fuscum]|uniref:hypothetical protein n=1 Tax=Sphaerisporangium fuscum TaxID=2835868 RepID=UPI001BDBB7D7|nr:hypothetical protein [Sphaerisporangium fuscum]
MARSEGTSPPSGAGPAALFTGLAVLADAVGVAQLLTSGPLTVIFVAGLLSTLIGLGVLIRRMGRSLGFVGLVMVALVMVGSGTTGAALDRFLTGPPAAASGTPSPSATTPATGVSSLLGDETPAPTTSPTPVGKGEVVRKGQADLADNDYLDLETGVVSEVNDASDIVYNGVYHELWTPGGGRLWITPFSGTPTMVACAEQLRARHYGSLPVKENGWVCLETAEKDIAAVQFGERPTRQDEGLTVSYTVWHR